MLKIVCVRAMINNIHIFSYPASIVGLILTCLYWSTHKDWTNRCIYFTLGFSPVLRCLWI